jgi:CheY-like chemotaxis protein
MLNTQPLIVIVDDDLEDLEMLTTSLEAYRIRTLTFRSGSGIIAHFEKAEVFSELPSLIILDYNMPVMNGLETLVKVKKIELISHIPLLIYSTTINQMMLKTAMDFGAYGCESKASGIDDLNAKSRQFAELAHSFSSQCKRINFDRAFG